jgi:hypothetical protein
MKKPEVGDVYLSNDIKITPQGSKMCICVHPAGLWFFLINSENRRMYDCIPILRENNDFLDHNSYIGTKDIFILDKNVLGKAFHIGRISDHDIAAILNKINNSKFIAPIHKREIINSISSWRIKSTSS